MKIWVRSNALDGVGWPIHDQDDPSRVRAVEIADNPLAHDFAWSLPVGVSRVIFRSGSLADDSAERHPANWLPPGRQALDAWLQKAHSQVADGTQLLLQPHARHVLSDVPSTRRFFEDHADSAVGLALNPTDLLEANMLERLEEHVERIFMGLGDLCSLLLMRDLDWAGEAISVVPLGQGRLPRNHVRRLIDAWIRPETPVVLHDELLAGQRAWLGAEGG